MTLADIIRKANEIALALPAVQSIVLDDVYALNDMGDARYGAFCAVEGTHTLSASGDLMTYALTLYYVDRRVAMGDGVENTALIHSTGITVLSRVVRELREYGDIPAVAITPFIDKFSDDCAGVYASVALTTAVDYDCLEITNY